LEALPDGWFQQNGTLLKQSVSIVTLVLLAFASWSTGVDC